ncbi:MAG: BlaI/MecI/CopY family transcriptional regulator [Gemmatimonadales bacterium]
MDPTFTDRELDIMTVLWERRSGTAAEVRAVLPDQLAYNTVLTMLGVLREKGFVRREDDGRAYRYFPIVARRKAKRSALRRLTARLFDGDPHLLVAELVSDRTLSDDDLRQLKQLLDDRIERRRTDR